MKVAKGLLRDAETEQDRAEAAQYLEAARARLAARWAERDGVKRAAALSSNEQAAWDEAESSRRYAETRCTAHELAADAKWGIDDTSAEHHDQLASHYRGEAEQHAATQERILAGALARRSAPAPAPVPAQAAGSSEADELRDASAAYWAQRDVRDDAWDAAEQHADEAAEAAAEDAYWQTAALAVA